MFTSHTFRSVVAVLALLAAFAPLPSAPAYAADTVSLKCTPIDICYCVKSSFLPAIEKNIKKIRAIIAAKRQEGKFIAYISIPLTDQAGGVNSLDADVASYEEVSLRKKYGIDLWTLTPGQSEYELPDGAGDGEYMYMWTTILAGPKGYGDDFDAVFFTGPKSFMGYMGIEGDNIIGQLKQYAGARAATDPAFATKINKPGGLKIFVDNYAFRSSVSFSVGCHDEWNIFNAINQRRLAAPEFGILKQLPIFFDGQAVPPSSYNVTIHPGSQATSCN